MLFTRSEKRALAVLARHPERLLTREQILDAITGPGSDKSDRNIDFLINRLRRKLSDNARAPRYIATRYGEGYVWIGRGTEINTDHAGAYLIVGPLRGLENLDDRRGLAELFASDLCGALRDQLPSEQRVVLAPEFSPANGIGAEAPNLAIELTFFEEGADVNCIATTREALSGGILAIHRTNLPSPGPVETLRSAADLAQSLVGGTWQALATQTGTGTPLPVLMHQAMERPDHDHGSLTDSDHHLQKLESLHINRTMAAWKENEARLKALLQASPDDAILKIMYATLIHSKYVTLGYQLFQAGIDDRARDEDDIEALVLSALPQVQSNPEYAIMAAKLLHFLDRGYFEHARELSEKAYASSLSAASSLALVGQLRAFAGDVEPALRCIDQALNLVPRDSRAHLYTLTIKLQALLAVGDFARLNETKHELYGISAVAMLLYEPLFSNPDKLSMRAKAVTLMLSRRKAAALLTFQHYLSARLFRNPEHRANSILTPLTLVIGRFGTSAVPEEIAATQPGLLDRFQ